MLSIKVKICTKKTIKLEKKMEQIETNQLQKNQPAGLQEDNKRCEHKLDVFD